MKEIDQAKFLSYMEVDAFEKIPAADFNKALYGIKLAKEKKSCPS